MGGGSAQDITYAILRPPLTELRRWMSAHERVSHLAKSTHLLRHFNLSRNPNVRLRALEAINRSA
jgi:hypothetical protein